MYDYTKIAENYPSFLNRVDVQGRKKINMCGKTEIFTTSVSSDILQLQRPLNCEIIPTVCYYNFIEPYYVILSVSMLTSNEVEFTSKLELDVNYTMSQHGCVKLIVKELRMDCFVDIGCVDIIILLNLIGLRTYSSCAKSGKHEDHVEVYLCGFTHEPKLIQLYALISKINNVLSSSLQVGAVLSVHHKYYSHFLGGLLKIIYSQGFLWRGEETLSRLSAFDGLLKVTQDDFDSVQED